MRAALPILRSIASRNVAWASRNYHADGHRPASVSDLPVPEGDWQEAYQQKQSKRNAILVASFLFFVGTVGFMKQSQIVNFNYGPPSTYE